MEIDGRHWQMGLGSRTAASVMLQADGRGHFVANAFVNGQPVPALVDTGASTVALNLRAWATCSCATSRPRSARRTELPIALLGMSFLNRLESWEVRADRLMLHGYP